MTKQLFSDLIEMLSQELDIDLQVDINGACALLYNDFSIISRGLREKTSGPPVPITCCTPVRSLPRWTAISPDGPKTTSTFPTCRSTATSTATEASNVSTVYCGSVCGIIPGREISLIAFSCISFGSIPFCSRYSTSVLMFNRTPRSPSTVLFT